MSSNINATGAAAAAKTPISERALALMRKALGDIKSGRLSGQLPNKGTTNQAAAAGDEAAIKEAGLRRRAEQLLKHLASNGALPSANALAELEAIVAEYFGPGLLGWLQPGETLANKRLKVDLRSQHGSLLSVDCDLAGSVQDLRRAVGVKLGAAGEPQLLCNGRPMSDEKQALYEWCACDGLGLRPGLATVQEVARNVGG